MNDPKPFQIRQAACPPQPGATIPITVELRFSFEPWLLEAIAEQSKHDGCGLENVIIEVLRQQFASQDC